MLDGATAGGKDLPLIEYRTDGRVSLRGDSVVLIYTPAEWDAFKYPVSGLGRKSQEVGVILTMTMVLFTAVGYRSLVDDKHQVAMFKGEVVGAVDVLVRVHSECLTGDVFGSERCDCGPQLDEALRAIVEEGRGVVVYLRGHEGRGIGLVAKLQAYQLQDGGRDTVDANLDLGLPADARHYGTATQILRDLGVGSVRLLTNNPAKVTNLEHYGIPVTERVPLTPHPNDHNIGYLLTKRDRMGHHLPDLHGHSVSSAEPVTVDQGGQA